MVGISIIRSAISRFIGRDGLTDNITEPAELLTGFITLAIIISLNVWKNNRLSLFCVLVAVICGCLTAYLSGVITNSDFEVIKNQPWLSLPNLQFQKLAFDWNMGFILIFLSMAATLDAVGDLSICQKTNDAGWKRPDFNNIGSGVFSIGLTNIISSIFGGMTVSTSSATVGLTYATGITSRIIGYFIGIILIVLSFCPKIITLFTIIPKPIVGAMLIFIICYFIVAGIQIIASRMLDSRKTFIIGISIIVALAVDMMPELFDNMHNVVKPIFGSSLYAGVITIIFLNLVFRIGIKKKVNFTADASAQNSGRIFDFVEECGREWGARLDVIHKVASAMNEISEIVLNRVRADNIKFELVYDEFNINLKVEYLGPPFEMPDFAPSHKELIEDENAAFLLSGFLIKKNADKIDVVYNNGTTTLKLNYIH